MIQFRSRSTSFSHSPRNIPVSKLKIPFPPRLGRNAFINFCARSFGSAPRRRKSYLLLAQKYNRLTSRPTNIVNKYSNTFVVHRFRQKNLSFPKKIFPRVKTVQTRECYIYIYITKEKEFHLKNTYHKSRSYSSRSFDVIDLPFFVDRRIEFVRVERAIAKREHRLIFGTPSVYRR